VGLLGDLANGLMYSLDGLDGKTSQSVAHSVPTWQATGGNVVGTDQGHPYNQGGDFTDGWTGYSTTVPSGSAAQTAAQTAAQQAAAQQAAQQASAARAISTGYDQVLSTLDRLMGDLPNQQNIANQQVGNLYNAQNQSLNSAYQSGQAHLGQAQSDLTTQTAKSLRSLAENIRSTFGSYDNQIGAQGGGDSSATGSNGQLAFALHKVESQNRSNILSDATGQQNQLNLKKSDLDSQLADNLNQLNTWKNNQILSIAQQFQQQKNQLDLQRAGANQQKLASLASYNTSLVNDAINALAGVEAQHQQAVSSITQQLNAPTLNTAPLAAANYQVQASPTVNIPGLSSGANQAAPLAIAPAKKLTDQVA
jgi:hypothetical protein